jgi:hypothetical protein
MERGWQVAVTLTPTAGQWLRMSGEIEQLEKLTRLPVRDEPRLPGDTRPHPPVDWSRPPRWCIDGHSVISF